LRVGTKCKRGWKSNQDSRNNIPTFIKSLKRVRFWANNLDFVWLFWRSFFCFRLHLVFWVWSCGRNIQAFHLCVEAWCVCVAHISSSLKLGFIFVKVWWLLLFINYQSAPHCLGKSSSSHLFLSKFITFAYSCSSSFYICKIY